MINKIDESTILEIPTVLPTITPDIDVGYVPTEETIRRISNAFAKYWSVMVWNDDIHSFGYVIEALVKVLGISAEQAAKHANNIHNNGKDIVATETREKAELYAQQLTELELTVTIIRNS